MADTTFPGTLKVEGNVGIGVEPLSNAQLYAVSSTSLSQILIENSDGVLFKLAADGSRACLSADSAFPIDILTDNEPRISIAETGNVGIGTTGIAGPEAKLEINGDLKLQQGVSVNEFSNDSAFNDNSDLAVPTEKAVKTYVDDEIDQVNTTLAVKAEKTYVDDEIDQVNTALAAKAEKTYVDDEIGQVNTALAAKADKTYVDDEIDQVNTALAAKADKTYVDDEIGQVNTALATKAEQTYVDDKIDEVNAAKAELNGSDTQDFKAKILTVQDTLKTDKLHVSGGGSVAGSLTFHNNLKVLGNFEVDGETTFRNIEQHQGDIELGNEDTDEVRIHGVLRSTHSSRALKISSTVDIGSAATPANLQVNGSVTATTFQGNGENLSGLVKKAGDTLTGPLTVDDSLTVNGKVGIGTTTPAKKLEVVGTIKAIDFEGDGSKLTGVVGSKWTLHSSGSLSYMDGKVGIGTTTPTQKLEVVGTVKATAFEGDGSKLTGISASLWTGGSGGSLSYTGGNVGIGTATPQGKLDVQGDIRAGNSDLYFTKTDHNHTGVGNADGYAAIENAANYGSLMILGRAGTPKGRYVKLWDYLQVNGGMDITGNVGIGTASPAAGAKLDVRGNLYVGGQAAIASNNYWHRAQANADNHYGYFEVRRKSGNKRGLYLGWGVPGRYVDLRLEEGNALAITGGRVGIGTKSPATALHVTGNRIRLENAGKSLDMRADGAAVDLQTTTSDLYIHSIGTGHDVIINPYGNEGNVGIGTSRPSTKLEVNGTLRAKEIEGKGAVTAFVSYDGKDRKIENGFNVASVTRVGVGRYDIRWSVTTNMYGPQICWVWGTGGGVRVSGRGSTPTLLQVSVYGANNQLVDDDISVVVY